MNEGWIKLHRKSLEHWLYKENRPHTKREAWEDILLLCNHSSQKILVQGELINCEKGQSVMSLKSWGNTFKWSIQRVRTFFNLLKNDNMIMIEGLRKTTRITVCKYEQYQNKQHTNNKQTTHKQQTNNKQITTNKNDKNDKNDKNKIDFEIFWNSYDKKVGKKSKIKNKWDKLSKEVQEKILDYIPKYIQSQPDKKYRKNPETFLNNESWNDEIITSKKEFNEFGHIVPEKYKYDENGNNK